MNGITIRWIASIACWLLIMPAGLVAYATPQNMVLVKGGTFQMGDASHFGRFSEQSKHEVSVKSFYIGKYEVTFNEYDAFCQDAGKASKSDRGWGRGQRPAFNVTWQDAVEYCNWRSRKEGLTPSYRFENGKTVCDFGVNGYRLPTEAEWEYAAKGGQHSQGNRYSGSDDAADVSWYKANTDETQVVGQKQPNELGLYDMSGNVWEWCWDWYDKTYYAGAETNNPTGPPSGSFHVIRGGDKNCYEMHLRLTYRHDYSISSILTYIGFRLVRSTL